MILTRTVYLDVARETASTLWYISRCCTRTWNAMIEDRQAAFAASRITGYLTQKALLPGMKTKDERLKDPSSQVMQEVVKEVDGGYKSFRAKRKNGDIDARPPGFRSSRNFFTHHYPQRGNSFEIENNQLLLAFGHKRGGRLVLDLPEGKYEKVKTVKVGFDDMAGKFVAWMTEEVEDAAPKTDGYWIYFDPGCKTTLTGVTSGGKLVEYDINPLRKMNMSTYRLLDKLMSRRDKKVKFSAVWRRLNKRVKSLWRKIAGRTKTYLHSLANQILTFHPNAIGFKIGDWKKQQTLADTGNNFVNRAINRAVQNNNPVRKLVEMLSYKAKLRTGQCVDEFDESGSTRTCVACDFVHKDGIDPEKRIFVCDDCGFTYPRDFHSCLNFLKQFEPAVWHGLREQLPQSLPIRSRSTTLAPFSLKPQRSETCFGAAFQQRDARASI